MVESSVSMNTATATSQSKILGETSMAEDGALACVALMLRRDIITRARNGQNKTGQRWLAGSWCLSHAVIRRSLLWTSELIGCEDFPTVVVKLGHR
jgi:hypothetical protein